MEVKANESLDVKCLLYYVWLGIVYLALILVPGYWYPQYYQILGTTVFLVIAFFVLRSYIQALFAFKIRKVDATLPENLPKVSLIIPSYNEEAVLERTIRSTLALDYPAEKLELIYVYESACTDRTEEVIKKYARQDSRIKPLRRPTEKGGKAPVTNFGLKAASGDIIGIFDADHSLNPDLVLQAVAQLQNPTVGCVRGRCRVLNHNHNLLARLVTMERNGIERLGIYGADRMGGFSNFGGGHGFFRREIFDEMGPFDEDVLTEDIDFSVKLHLAGYKILALPQMQSWEEAPTSFVPFYQQRKRWTRGWMQVWRRHCLSILKAKKISLFKKCDILVSLFSSMSPVLILSFLPLLLLTAFGVKTSIFSPMVSFWLWIFITTAPIISAWLVWILDQAEEQPASIVNVVLAPLLIPYIIFHFFVGWLCFMDEFVLGRMFSYVKTERAIEVGNQKETVYSVVPAYPGQKASATTASQIAMGNMGKFV